MALARPCGAQAGRARRLAPAACASTEAERIDPVQFEPPALPVERDAVAEEAVLLAVAGLEAQPQDLGQVRRRQAGAVPGRGPPRRLQELVVVRLHALLGAHRQGVGAAAAAEPQAAVDVPVAV